MVARRFGRGALGIAAGTALVAACSSQPNGAFDPLGTPDAGGAGDASAPVVTGDPSEKGIANGARAAGDPVAIRETSPAIPTAPLRRDGLMPGARPFRGPDFKVDAKACGGAHLTYYGGQLLQKPIVVPVFWNSDVNAQVQANVPQFYADITVSSYWSWLEEYDSVGLAAPTTSQAILSGTATAGVLLVPSTCKAGSGSCTVKDAQIQAELSAQITAGILPAPVNDCTGNARTIYMVHFPPLVTTVDPNKTRSCVTGGFCAYHGTGTYAPTSQRLLYGVLMDEFTSPCASGCGTNATGLENTTDTASHELVEAATDTDVGLAVTVGPPLGWYDNACGEIGDICDDGVSPGDTFTVSGRTWTVQQVWSNKQGKCTSTGPGKTCPAGDNCGTISDSCDGTITCGGTCTAPQVCSSNVCCMPKTACPAGDNCGTVPDGCGGTVSCGTCASPQTCGGSGKANTCGCTPAASCPAGDNCGTVPDGCGGTVSCGTCASPQTCGGGSPSTANVCGCTPATTCPAGDDCGTVPDGCGGTVTCGTCSAGSTCAQNQCLSAAVDAGSGIDAGALDAGSPADGGSRDGGATKDAGLGDAGSAPDAGNGRDAGNGADGGPLPDAGNLEDAASDGATASDANGGPDAAGVDSGSLEDGSAEMADGGDAGAATPGQSGGCGCKTAGSASSTQAGSLFGAFALVGGALARRRRRGPQRASR